MAPKLANFSPHKLPPFWPRIMKILSIKGKKAKRGSYSASWVLSMAKSGLS